uniref:RRM domain-containing protein n=1 Tax=Pseudo-nitzschia delicatissima TaxID=44447 RepID=A0A7S0UER9_9STRA|mmetsp:Transcript_1316/g.2716  ORF Transcript_1316/g.2716 Transcript_1316/m.2716 type:complete len:406 (+) Transcript_1316:1-1218(+)
MVVTASVIFNGSGSVKTERRKTFVQTFFLAKNGRNFAVTNDILRFLTLVAEPETPEELEEAVYVDANTGTDDELEVTEKTETAESTALVADEKKTDPMEDKTAAVIEDESSAPGGGVEETKEEAPEEDSTGSDSKKISSSKENKGKKNKGAKQQQQPPPASKPAPGSWASLVVSGGSAPNTPSRAPEKKAPNNNIKPSTKQPPLPPSDDAKDNGETEKKSEKDKSMTPSNGKANAKSEKANNNNNNNTKSKDKERTKRDPDNTLVIKNLSENIKEQDILGMFQPFATATKAKIVGTNLNHHRLLAFVDYDSVAPVMAALKKHKETPFEWNGKVLEVDQKTLEQRARRKAGGNQNTSNNQNNQNNNNQNNGFRNAGAGRGGNSKYNNNQNGRGDGGGRRRGTRAGR